jgi:hypothetical protein
MNRCSSSRQNNCHEEWKSRFVSKGSLARDELFSFVLGLTVMSAIMLPIDISAIAGTGMSGSSRANFGCGEACRSTRLPSSGAEGIRQHYGHSSAGPGMEPPVWSWMAASKAWI